MVQFPAHREGAAPIETMDDNKESMATVESNTRLSSFTWHLLHLLRKNLLLVVMSLTLDCDSVIDMGLKTPSL